jgi:predicted dehydrogenase
MRIGVLGAAGIAPQAIIRPASRREDVVIAAVASRSEQSALGFARANQIEVAYGGYQTLLDDDSIDLVYIALPPSEHAQWSIAALESGKHVLCEKPVAMNAVQAEEMATVASRTGRRLIEAFHDRYHPLSDYLLRVQTSRELGQLLSLDACFTVAIPFDRASIRHDPALGGGALMDLGCYPVHWIRFIVGEEPKVVSACYRANAMGADETIEAILLFPSGVEATVSASMAENETFSATLVVKGTRGTLEVDNPVLPHNGHSVRITTDGVQRTLTIGGGETYDYQLDAVINALAGGGPLPTESADFVANMATIDAFYRAAGLHR